jgi:predicted ATPase/DNA-binding CsgD family transcriptional regulator
VRSLRAHIERPDVRLLVVTGPGGVGKTRLAVAAAAEAAREFVDGIRFVALAPIRAPDLVVPAIAATLGVRDDPGQPPREGLLELLRQQCALLLLDNFEQVASAATDLVDLLAACPRIKMLVTSRAVLQAYGEHEFPLAPLSLPGGSAAGSIEQLRESEAVRLFEVRARAADPDFRLSADNAAAVAEICRRLDGLPLAIELAAARIRLLPPSAMLTRFGRRLPLLVGAARGVPDRQRTLRNTIDWSYDLLNEREKALVRQLAVFVGGWTLHAAQVVVSTTDAAGTATTWSEHELMDGVQSLLDKSWLRPEPGSVGPDREPRFGMLETIAEYALDTLDEHGETDAVLQRHAGYFIRLAEEADPQLFSGSSEPWFARLEREHDNFRRALRWCLETRRIEAGFRLATALWWFWTPGGHLAEGRVVLNCLLAAASRPTRWRARALYAAGSLALQSGELAVAEQLHTQELAIHRLLGDRPGELSALESLALIAVRQGDTAGAAGFLDQAFQVGREIGGMSNLLTRVNLSNIAHEEGDLDRARALLDEGIAGLRYSDRPFNLCFTLMNRGVIARDQGDLVAAQAFSEEALQIAEQIGQRHMAALCVVNLGSIAAVKGQLEQARLLFQRGLLILAELGDRGASAAALERCAEVVVAQGQFARALQLVGAADAQRKTSGLTLPLRALSQLEQRLEPARRALGAAAAAEAWAIGSALSLGEAVRVALERQAADSGPLSPRELEVAALVAEGLSNRQIADRLVISARTADNHVQHILNKLDLTSRVQLAAWVVQRNKHP